MRTKEELNNNLDAIFSNENDVMDLYKFNLSNDGEKTEETAWSEGIKKVLENNKDLLGV